MAAPDGARGDHAPARLVGVRGRGDLDRVAVAVHLDDERRVVELAARPVLARGGDRLEDATVEADRVTPRAERDPVQVDGCRSRALHASRKAAGPRGRWHPDSPEREARPVRSPRPG
jgi:hypothetical protein